MQNRFARFAVVVLAVLLAIIALQPYAERLLFSATTPRAVEPRGQLADIERSTIEIFQRAAPSVVQVVGRPATAGSAQIEGEDGQQSGTGFVWDAAGHLVTNDHVVRAGGEVAVRLASGEVARAEIVGSRRITIWRSCASPVHDSCRRRWRSARSADLKVGQSAFAIGNPFGLDQSLTSGIICALKRRLPTSAVARSPTSSRPTRRSILAIRAGRCSIPRAASSASRPPSIRRPGPMPASALRSRSISSTASCRS